MLKGNIFIDNSFIFGEVRYENGLITDVTVLDADDLSEAERENYIIPGLVDIHLHGCMGVDFCDASEHAVERMINYENSVGVTSICPATMTLDEDTLVKVMQAVSRYKADDKSYLRDNLVGIYLEGPFISYEKKGAQNPDFIKRPNAEMIRRLDKESGGMIKAVSVAPEVDGAIDFIREMNSDYVCSIAHSAADYDTAMEAFCAGADHVTHLYNAMPQFLNRSPGIVGAAFDEKSTYVELITDGIHIHPSVVRATFEMFGADRVVLVSDSMEATGMPDGKYALGGQTVYKMDNLATLLCGTLAGSVTNLFDCMKMAVKMGIPPETAILAATLNPAKSLGLDAHIGSITVGKQAKMVVCDKSLNIKEVIS